MSNSDPNNKIEEIVIDDDSGVQVNNTIVVSDDDSDSQPKPKEDETEPESDIKITQEKIGAEVIFLKEVKKKRALCDEVIVITETQTPNQNQNRDTPQRPRRVFTDAQQAASTLVVYILKQAERRVNDEQLFSSEYEYQSLYDIGNKWRYDNLRQRFEEEDQAFFWRVRGFTKYHLMEQARHMYNTSALGWAVVENNKDHVLELARKAKSNGPTPAKKFKREKVEKKEEGTEGATKTDSEQSEPLPDIKLKQEPKDK